MAGRIAVCLAAGSVLCAGSAFAGHKHRWHSWHGRGGHAARNAHVTRNWHWQPTHRVFQLTDPAKDAALVLDGETGRVLYARNPDALRHPASLTKMMTLYLLFEQLKNGQMTLATPIPISMHAAWQAPTKLYARPGTTISVEDAIKAVVVLSANDVAVAIAEAIGGTESHFAEMMTAKARSWGMTHTFFHNASGLPDNLQITSAGDLGILARHLAYDYPQYFHYFSTYSFTWHGATHFTHDNLIGRYDGADGIKTGYTGASGFNLVSSVVRNGVHIIGVVMGGTTARRRDTEMVRLLDDTFAAIGKNPQLAARAPVPWQTLAQNAAVRPVIAGFQFGTANTPPPSIASPLPQAQQLRSGLVSSGPEDEEAAESAPDPAYEPTPITTKPVVTAPKAKMVTLAPPSAQSKPTSAAASPAPAAKPGVVPTQDPPAPAAPAKPISAALLPPPGKVVIASLEPVPGHSPAPAAIDPAPQTVLPAVATPRPKEKPSVPPLALYDDQTAATPKVENNWTIQIGAYGNATLAQSELAQYARKSSDLLGEAARIVAPLESPEGHVIYRARFGPFDEDHARQVCQALTQRGQTCFAAIASR